MKPVTVIHTETEDGTEWCVSFGNGCNPDPEDYVAVRSKADAFRLKSLVEALAEDAG